MFKSTHKTGTKIFHYSHAQFRLEHIYTSSIVRRFTNNLTDLRCLVPGRTSPENKTPYNDQLSCSGVQTARWTQIRLSTAFCFSHFIRKAGKSTACPAGTAEGDPTQGEINV